MEDKRYLTFALGKGRLAKTTLKLFEQIGITCEEIQDPDSRNEIFAVLESYIMRRMIVRATTKNSNNLFASLILNNVLDAATLKERLSRNSDVTTYFPDDRELLQGFKESKLINLQSKGVLYMMESAIQPVNAAMVLLGFKGYSLEHLMPKK